MSGMSFGGGGGSGKRVYAGTTQRPTNTDGSVPLPFSHSAGGISVPFRSIRVGVTGTVKITSDLMHPSLTCQMYVVKNNKVNSRLVLQATPTNFGFGVTASPDEAPINTRTTCSCVVGVQAGDVLDVCVGFGGSAPATGGTAINTRLYYDLVTGDTALL